MTKPTNKKQLAYNAGVKAGMQKGMTVGVNIGIGMAKSPDHTQNGYCLEWDEEATRYTLDPDCQICKDISQTTGIPLTHIEPLVILTT